MTRPAAPHPTRTEAPGLPEERLAGDILFVTGNPAVVIDGLRLVSQQISAAVASGENLHNLADIYPLIANRAVDVINVWTGQSGVTGLRQIAHMAHAHGLPVSMMNAQANYMAQIAAALPNHCAMEVVDPGREHCLVWHDQIEDGYIVLGDAPGFGIAVNFDSGAATASVTGALNIGIANDFAGPVDQYTVTGLTGTVELGLFLEDFTATAFGSDALPQLPQLGRLQHGVELGLRDQDDLDQLRGVGLEVREEPHLLERLAVEVLRLVDQQQHAAPFLALREEEAVELIHQLAPRLALRVEAELAVDDARHLQTADLGRAGDGLARVLPQTQCARHGVVPCGLVQKNRNTASVRSAASVRVIHECSTPTG
jgi:hypothetical protein